MKRRMPINCEPCRSRKIRCARNPPPGPCETCVRRGVPPSECVYLRRGAQTRALSEQNTAQVSNDELLVRIQTLENLLRDNNDVPSNAHALQDCFAPTTLGMNVRRYQSHSSDSTTVPALSSLSPSLSTPALIGTLHISATGHVRYQPRASQWSSILDESPLAAHVKDFDGSSCDDPSRFPFCSSTKVDRQQLIAALPPIRQCNELKDVFLEVFSPLFHIIHEPTFLADYTRFQDDPESPCLSWLALLFVIMSIAVTAADDKSPLLRDLGRKPTNSQNIAILSARYRQEAMACLEADHYLWRHNVYTLQALILLIYGINHTHGKTWALLGLTHNIAMALGCHIDPQRFGLGLVQSEERRRCWAGLKMLYTMQNTTMGVIDRFPINYDVGLPADLNDSDLTEAIVPITLSTAPTQMTYMLFKFRTYDICSKICDVIFGHQTPTYEWIMGLEQDIFVQQDKWNARYLSDCESSDMPVHHTVHLNILYGYSHQLMLLLHRPILINALSGLTVEQINDSRNRCIDSARGLLQIYRTLGQTAQFAPFLWYTRGLGSFHAFHAAVVLVFVLSTPDGDRRFHEISAELKNTLNMFDGMAEYSTVAAKAVPLLRYLMTSLSAEHRTLQTPTNLDCEQTGHDGQVSQMEALMARLQPQEWLSPSTVTWGEWDFLLGNNSFHQVIAT